jgi:predicted negative regulator of RcsB-dependent stress response
MKKKEREHLKEDPFQLFVEKVLTILRQYKKEIYIGFTILVVAVLTVAITGFIQSHTSMKENAIYSKALAISDAKNLTPDQKIEKMNQLDIGKGISSTITLMIAKIYLGKGDTEQATKSLKGFKGSQLKIIEDQKKMLDAEILNSSGKKKEAVDLLYKLYSDPEVKLQKDYLLLKIARIQADLSQVKSAITNLNKMKTDHPNSFYMSDVQQLLSQLESK